MSRLPYMGMTLLNPTRVLQRRLSLLKQGATMKVANKTHKTLQLSDELNPLQCAVYRHKQVRL